MNKTVKYSISIFVLILVVTGIYSTYLLSGKGLTLDLFKERILTKYQLDSKVALDDISGIKLKFNRQYGIFLEIQKIELRSIFFSKSISLSDSLVDFKNEHAFANSRARLRMTTLYQVAASSNGIVVGTGNKVEDFGVGFYTKYGDGGVDISPIADCTKSQVWEMGNNLGILKEIIKAEPTDGLWDDGRTDVTQLGMSYQELEEAMKDSSNKNHKKYLEIRKRNLHKMKSIPVCKMKDD